MIPQSHARSRLVFGLLIFFLAQRPNALALPVLLSIPTKPPSRAQNRKILIFQPSESTSAIKSVRFRIATIGFPPAAINAPEIIPKNRDTIIPWLGKTPNQLYYGTIERYNFLQSVGMEVFFVWDYDYKAHKSIGRFYRGPGDNLY